ncbi:unnamed protein product [Ixodes hexagonus]
MDIKDLYYSLEPKTLLVRVRQFLENNLVRFQAQSGIAVADFLKILELYLQATVVRHDERVFIQKRGISIGSAVAPVLSEIYLSFLDLKLHDLIRNCSPSVVLVRRYVDDLLFCSTDASLTAALEKAACDSSPELKFSVDRPESGSLQFLDLQLKHPSSLCWEYGKPTLKPLPPFHSCHSKHVKAGIVRNLINSTLKKSCSHSISSALGRLFDRFGASGYPQDYVSNQLLFLVSAKKKCEVSPKPTKRVVLPFFHQISRNLRSIGNRHGVSTVFSNDYKLSRMTPFASAKDSCTKKHREKEVNCVMGVVYKMPFDCGLCYLG